jgi:hypothetical protein
MQLAKNERIRKQNLFENFRSFSDEIDNFQISSGQIQQDNVEKIQTQGEYEVNNKNKIMNKYEKVDNSNLFLTKSEAVDCDKKKKELIDIIQEEKNYNLKTERNFNKKNISAFNTIYNSPKSYEETLYNNFSPVKIKFPNRAKKDFPPLINNLTRSLNKELERICRSYGKIDAIKRFKKNPTTQYHFDNHNYYAYRTAKVTENMDKFRPKLKPLNFSKEGGLERMSNSIFHIRSRMAETLKEFGKENRTESLKNIN